MGKDKDKPAKLDAAEVAKLPTHQPVTSRSVQTALPAPVRLPDRNDAESDL
jgi:hypothetical protein